MRGWRPAGSAVRRWPGWVGLAGALLLHGGILWLLLPHGAGRPGVALDEPPVVEIEMVDQAEEAKGTPAPSAGQPPPPEEAPPPEPARAEQGTPPPPPPAPPAPPARAPAPVVNLGTSDQDQEALRVTGDNVVPPRPDALFHNKPPTYPIEAARRRREGIVHIRAWVGTAGVPETVEVAGSSGDASLDRAAREAVELWRFQPARNNGVAVPFEYEVSIAFKRGDR